MEKELFGVGKTWLLAYILIGGATAMVFTGHLTSQQWLDFVPYIFGGASLKSGLKKIGENKNDHSS